MKFAPRHLILASLLGCIGFAATAQGTPPTPAPGNRGPQAHEGMHRHDPAKMAEHHAKRQAALRDKLKITASQEAAWSRFADATKPPAERPDRAEFAKLTTPERIDRMQAMKTQRDAEMTKRADATKSLYAALTPEQQKVFDAETARGPGHRGHRS